MSEGGRPGPSTQEIPLPGGQPPRKASGSGILHPQLAPAPQDAHAAGDCPLRTTVSEQQTFSFRTTSPLRSGVWSWARDMTKALKAEVSQAT